MRIIDAVNAISDDFGSTFTVVNESTLANFLCESDLTEVEGILKKHLGSVTVDFKRTQQMPENEEGGDIWIISIS